jgi:pyruvate formate lyase activating enzyme
VKRIFAILFLLAVVGLAVLHLASRQRAAAPGAAVPAASAADGLHEAEWYEKRANGLVHCQLCPNSCRLPDGQIGLCRVRKNIGGTLYSLSYGQVAAVHVDPIEKKPFFHVLPGEKAFSLATPGCNMHCLFCQNWEIAMAFPWEVHTTPSTPEQVVEAALRSGAKAIAFTYSEPTIFYEYMLDIARLAKAKGLKTLVVSNGYIQPEPLKALLPFIDAYKVDFKAFDPKFYSEMTGGSREPVLQTMKIIRASGVWLEIVNLLVTGQNDDEEQVRQLARWVKENLGDDVPLHFSRFHPMHKLLNLPPTPIENVVRAREIAREEGLKHVYTGNIPVAAGDSTYSPTTGRIVIERKGYFVIRNDLANGLTPEGEKIPGVWQ